MKNKAYIIGLAMVLTSFILSVMSYYMLPLMLPIYALGGILIFFSKKRLDLKILTLAIPLVLYLPSTIVFLSWFNRPTDPVTFLVPENFEGPFTLVKNEKCGIKPAYENGRMLLAVPPNGVLVIQKEIEGSIDYEWFYIDRQGKRKRIGQYFKGASFDKTSPFVILGSGGSASFSLDYDDRFHFEEFTVYNKDTNVIHADDSKHFEMVREIVTQCRTKSF